MARKKVDDTPKPEAPAPVSLLRVEERVERVPISAEQAQERMRAAAAVIHEARILDGEHAEQAAAARATKKRAEAKHEEADRIVLDATTGTMATPYPVIVERHPSRPAEMLVWRVPDGMTAADLLEMPAQDPPRTDVEHMAAREAQGCMLIESRAMTPDEVDVARRVDAVFRSPELPFDQVAQSEAVGAQPIADDGDDEDGDDDLDEGGEEEPIAAEGPEALKTEEPAEQQAAAGGEVAAEAKPEKKRPVPKCPEPAGDGFCDEPGAHHLNGFCEPHAANYTKAQRMELSRKAKLARAAQRRKNGEGSAADAFIDGGAATEGAEAGELQ